MSDAREKNVEILKDTLLCAQRGYYIAEGKRIPLKLTGRQMQEAQVFLPEDLEQIRGKDGEMQHSPDGRCGDGGVPPYSPDGCCRDGGVPPYSPDGRCRDGDVPPHSSADRCGDGGVPQYSSDDRCTVDCINADSFFAAREVYAWHHNQIEEGKEKPVLVLNLANAVHPGGGVRRGARAQEEDLCRKSTLLLSLESKAAEKYYTYNKKKNTMLGSDGIIISPSVEIFRNESGDYLTDSVVVSIMTCAAPNVRRGFAGLSPVEYEQLLYRRIEGMFTVAAHLGYRYLVLGAFGCGAFANDARVVSRVFGQVMKDFRYQGTAFAELFSCARFAVLDHTGNQYNFRRFSEMAREFYQ